MKALFIKHIHNCFASFASGDEFLGIEIDNFTQEIEKTEKHKMNFFEIIARKRAGEKVDLEPKILENSVIRMPGHALDGEIVDGIEEDPEFPGYMIVSLQSDKTFYNPRAEITRRYADTPEFKALVQSYIDKGWKRDYESDEYKAYRKFEEEKRLFERANEELVLWNYGEDGFDPIQYNGGFSDELINHPTFKNYVDKGCCFGWIGDSGARRREHDKAIEEGLRNLGSTVEEIAGWTTSTDGRHFAESLYGLNLTEQLEEIKKNLPRIYNIAKIFSHPDHKGTAKSSIKIRKQLEEQGELLTEIHNL